MTSERLPWALGWVRLGIGLTELALLAVTLGRPRAKRIWHGALMAAAAGATLVDVYAIVASRNTAPRRSGRAAPSPELVPEGNAPAESWRGSGLAEDVGVSRREGEEGEPDEVKQRMMGDAARELGLPETR
jgi:hypothetical protein